ncbi:glutamate cyclase domain-containing protein [Nocardioides sp. AE5]|uniref:glutamate cyclase domain-containing protein n=1 Tax=Nocardioides sp. AE5 TaxID=2962573 RepID=UPI0028817D52|nr:glutamate cyclase domain-containing protein [Nocardioides sp. AE5]MDT0202474.1 DUF4392 domain-containing protein [Nocardioides sp. AE5]
MNPNDELGLLVGEVVDQLTTVQFYMGGGAAAYSKPAVRQLYEAARREDPEPLSYQAARALVDAISEGDNVLILTGLLSPPVLVPETDGPIGALTLARSLALGLGAKVTVLIEDGFEHSLTRLAPSSGLTPAPSSGAIRPQQIAVAGFPLDEKAASSEAERLIEKMQPKAVIAIEKLDCNTNGVFHNGGGIDMGAVTAPMNRIVDRARTAGVLTIGIGDGGNEIGLGNIETSVRQILAMGMNCGCPCGGGIAASTPTDLTIVAAVANWGAYAIETVMAALLGRPELLHSEAISRRLHDEAARCGYIDPASCQSDGFVDGLPPEMSTLLVKQLHIMLAAQMNPNGRREIFRSLMADRATVQAQVDSWPETRHQ